MNELVGRVGFPMRRLATTRHDHAMAALRPSGFAFDRRGQVHDKRYRAQYPFSVVNQSNHVSQTGFAAQIQNPIQGGVVMLFVTELNEQKTTLEVIDNGLPSTEMPPLDRVIVLPARHDKPVRHFDPRNLADDGGHRLLGVGKVYISLELGWRDSQAKLFVEVFDEAVKKMQGALVGESDQRILAFENLNFGVTIVERSQIRVVLPKVRPASPDVSEEPTRGAGMQVADRRRQRHGIAWSL
jgi:hypothetical protein